MTGKLRHYKVCIQQDGSLSREIPMNGFGIFQAEFVQLKSSIHFRKMTYLGPLQVPTPTDPQLLIHTTTYYRHLNEAYPSWLKDDHMTYFSDHIVHLHNARWGVGKKTTDGYFVPARLFDRESPAAAALKVKSYPAHYGFKTAMQAYHYGKTLGWEWAR